jgi:hypothetical protein
MLIDVRVHVDRVDIQRQERGGNTMISKASKTMDAAIAQRVAAEAQDQDQEGEHEQIGQAKQASGGFSLFRGLSRFVDSVGSTEDWNIFQIGRPM